MGKKHRPKQALQNRINNAINESHDNSIRKKIQDINNNAWPAQMAFVDKYISMNQEKCSDCKLKECTLKAWEAYCNHQMISIEGMYPNFEVQKLDKPTKSINQLLGIV